MQNGPITMHNGALEREDFTLHCNPLKHKFRIKTIQTNAAFYYIYFLKTSRNTFFQKSVIYLPTGAHTSGSLLNLFNLKSQTGEVIISRMWRPLQNQPHLHYNSTAIIMNKGNPFKGYVWTSWYHEWCSEENSLQKLNADIWKDTVEKGKRKCSCAQWRRRKQG